MIVLNDYFKFLIYAFLGGSYWFIFNVIMDYEIMWFHPKCYLHYLYFDMPKEEIDNELCRYSWFNGSWVFATFNDFKKLFKRN